MVLESDHLLCWAHSIKNVLKTVTFKIVLKGTSDTHHTCKQGTILEESARVAVDK